MPTAPASKSKPSTAATPAKKPAGQPLQATHADATRRIAERYLTERTKSSPPPKRRPQNRQEALYGDAPARPRRSSLREEWEV
jgi:hypothetical protein